MIMGCWHHLHPLTQQQSKVCANLDSLSLSLSPNPTTILTHTHLSVLRFGGCSSSSSNLLRGVVEVGLCHTLFHHRHQQRQKSKYHNLFSLQADTHSHPTFLLTSGQRSTSARALSAEQ